MKPSADPRAMRHLEVRAELLRSKEELCTVLEKLRKSQDWTPGQIYETLLDESEDAMADYWYEWWTDGIESEEEEWA